VQPAAAQLVADAMASYERGDLDALAAFVHPEAEIEMLALGGVVAHGPEELVEALTQAREGIHRPTMTSVKPLGTDAALMIGRIQFTDGRGGLSDRNAVWLTVLRDGLLWRTRVFATEGEARAFHESLVADLQRDAR
jgi:SnoaL-like domain